MNFRLIALKRFLFKNEKILKNKNKKTRKLTKIKFKFN